MTRRNAIAIRLLSATVVALIPTLVLHQVSSTSFEIGAALAAAFLAGSELERRKSPTLASLPHTGSTNTGNSTLELSDAVETYRQSEIRDKNTSSSQRHLQRRPKVLFVDDEPSITRAVQILLTRSGYNALAAISGIDALHIIRTEPIDMMISDLRIPDMRGDILLEHAIQLQPHLAQKTLFITGDVTEEAEQLLAATGCPYLMKPFDVQDLRRAVRAILEDSAILVGTDFMQ